MLVVFIHEGAKDPGTTHVVDPDLKQAHKSVRYFREVIS
jgi:hypothetical protein